MEPPTPLRNADFRSLITSTPRHIPRPTTSATPSHPSSSATSSTSSHPPPPPKSTKRLEHYHRHLAKQAARHQPDAASTPATRPPQYRDRARERRQDVNPDYVDSADLRVSEGLTEETSKFLGGDEAHTHLVKGLDFALLRKVKEEEERRELEQLDDLLHQPSPASAAVPALTSSHPPVFHSTLAQQVYDLVLPSAVTPSDLFLPGRLTYRVKLPQPSKVPLLPQVLAAPAVQRPAMLAALNELPISVLASKDEVTAAGDRISGFVPPSVLRQLRATMEKKREKRKRRKQSGSASTQPSEGPADVASDGEDESGGREEKRSEPQLSLEERRKRLVELDDEDVFADLPPVGPQPLPTTSAAAITVPISTHLPSSAVFKPAAPTSKYFQTAAPSTFTSPLPAVEDTALSAVPSAASFLPSSSPPAVGRPSASTPSMGETYDEYDELYPDAAISFSGHLAGDEDSDEEAERLKDKERAREEKLSAKRGGRRRGGGGRQSGAMDAVELKKEERRREAKIDRELEGVTRLLKSDKGKLRLDAFEKEGAAQDAAKRLKIG